ncbi:hypothetical protein JNK13_09110 [bacterium]|nr:hypothetical protein [bacterium]
MKTKFLLTTSLTLLASSTLAAPVDFGGWGERIKGAGDKIPPQCTFDVPRGAKAPFSVTWYCQDNFTKDPDITTEVYLKKKTESDFKMVYRAMGFPAAFGVGADTLGVTAEGEFTDGLPASFRFVAIDRSGNRTISQEIQVTSEDLSVSSCSMELTTAGTEATEEGETGIPESTLSIDSTSVTTSFGTTGGIQFKTVAAVEASTCDIESLCGDGTEPTSVSFSCDVSGTSSLTGTCSVSPGAEAVTVTGTSTSEGGNVSALELTGETEVDGQAATLSINCSK